MTEKNLESANHENEKFNVDVDRAWSALKGRLDDEGLIPEQEIPVRRLTSPAFRIAASVAIIVTLGIGGWFIFSDTGNDMNVLAKTGIEEQYGLSLPDGSVVDLNSHSRIQFREDEDGKRMVNLSGEAYFNVSPDQDKPFIIRSGEAVIRVTGTSFTVRTTPGSHRVEVYVESGSVQLYQTGDSEHMINVKKGYMGILENSILSREENTDENYLSWKTRKLAFRQTELGEVARVLNRTYKKDILFESTELEHCLFTGTFDRQPVDSVIRVLQIALNLEVEQGRDAYIFSGEGCN